MSLRRSLAETGSLRGRKVALRAWCVRAGLAAHCPGWAATAEPACRRPSLSEGRRQRNRETERQRDREKERNSVRALGDGGLQTPCAASLGCAGVGLRGIRREGADRGSERATAVRVESPFLPAGDGGRKPRETRGHGGAR